MDTFVSDISGKHFPVKEKVPGGFIRESIMKLIRDDHPDFDRKKNISYSELGSYHEKYISSYLEKEVGELTELDKKVLKSISGRSLLKDLENEDEDLTLGQRVADKVALFGGSWRFIILFMLFILLWMTTNVFLLLNKGFDPYPFILLNLILSCLAALQAPIIMMSQNRQAEKDRERSRNDYMVNLKSELEVRGLHEKFDHLMLYQQQELIEIQKVQIEMLTDIIQQLDRKMRKSSKTGTDKKQGESSGNE